MDITIVTSAVDDDGGKALLEAFGFPFKRGEDDTVASNRRRGAAPGPHGASKGPRRSDRTK